MGESLIDSLIAATALEQGCIVVTRNAADFARAGVEIHGPWVSGTAGRSSMAAALGAGKPDARAAMARPPELPAP